MNNKPKPSGETSQQRNQRYNSQNFSQQNPNNSNQKNNNNNNYKKRYNNHNNGSGKPNNTKTFEYVRKVDTVEGQEELRRKLQQLEQEEKLRQEAIMKQLLEEEERQRELELQHQIEQERLEQLELLKCYIQENIIMPIFADAEKNAQQRLYLKSFGGLSYLLSTNFFEFEDQISQEIPIEIQQFNERQYESVTQQSNLRRRHQTGYQNQSYQNDEQYSPQQQRYGANRNQRMTVRQTINNFQNNKKQNNNQQQTGVNNNGRHQNNRNRNFTYPNQPDANDVEDQDSKWRQSRTPLFSQSQDELKFLLNIVTPDNFNNLKEQFFQLCQANVNKCIFSLISKVCKEAKYTKLYAQMAIYIQDREEEIEKLNNSPSNFDLSKSFKGQMFAILQDLFYDQNKLHSILSSNSKQSMNDQIDDEELNENDKRINSKQEAMEKKGFSLFLKFLGELFLSKFLPKKIISYIFQTMTHQYISGGLKEEDRNLEGVILLMDSIGPEFESSWNNISMKQIKIDSQFLSQVTNQFCDRTQSKLDIELFESQFISFDGIMNILKYLKNTEHISKRFQILIVNLIKRWENKWKKALHQKEDPRTKEEIRNQHFNELNRRQQEVYENFDYTKEVKKVFLQLDQNQLSQDECQTQFSQLGFNNILQGIFTTFFDARLENLSARYQLVSSILFESDKYQYTTFLSSLNSVLNTIYSQSCDFPHLNDSFVNILCPLIMNGYLELSLIKPALCGDPDEDEDKNYFFNQLKNDCVSYLKSINYFMIED